MSVFSAPVGAMLRLVRPRGKSNPPINRRSAHRSPGRLIGAIAASTALSLTLAACGSDGSDGSKTSAGGKDAVVVGLLCSCTGPAAASLSSLTDLASAWEKSTNEAGGINGTPVKVVAYDDAGVAATALQNAQKLVKQDNAIAIISQSNQKPAFAKYTNEVGIPVLAASDPATYKYPSWFGVAPSQAAYIYGQNALAKELGGGTAKLGLIGCAETPVCASSVATLDKLAKQIPGVSVAYTATVSASAPNFTAQCLAAKEAGVTVLNTYFSLPTVNDRIWSDCAKQGFTPKKISSLSSENLANPEADGAYSIVWEVSQADTTTDGMKLFNEMVDKYAPKIKSNGPLTFNTIDTFANFQAFKKAAENAKLTASSEYKDLQKGFFAFKDETLGGLTSPLTFVEGEPYLVNCWFTNKVEDGKFASGGTTPSCIPDDAIEPVYAALGMEL